MISDFRIEGGDVDAAYLEQEVARRVEQRRESGAYTKETEAHLAESLPAEDYSETLPPIAALDYAATRACSSWEITPAYPVMTEKRFLRPLVIFLKRLARLWARVAVGPMQVRQSAFNRHVSQALDALRRQAIAERARARAAEEDLCALVDALVSDEENTWIAEVCTGAVAGAGRLTVIGPCPYSLIAELESRGCDVLHVSPGSAWEQGGGEPGRLYAPFSFVEQLPEESVEAVLIPEIAFWLRPERLVGLVRRGYLSLKKGGPLLIVVHGFATGSPSPAWCEPPVVERALEQAGFSSISITGEPEAGRRAGGFVATAHK